MVSVKRISAMALTGILSFSLLGGFLVAFQVAEPTQSKVTEAKADSIGYDGDYGAVTNIPSASGCLGGCNVGTSKGGGGGGGGVIPTNIRSQFYSCRGVSGGGSCTIGGMNSIDSSVGTLKCNMSLFRGGSRISSSGSVAVNYLRNRLVGFWWNPGGETEQMFSHLTGRDLGWFPYPVAFGDVSQGYNGTKTTRTFGSLRWGCYNTIDVRTQIDNNKTATCAPRNDGRPFPYAVGYVVTQRNNNEALIIGSASAHKNRDWRIIGESCVYVSASTPPPKIPDVVQTCYWNIKHTGWFSQNRSTIANGGQATSVAPVSPRDNTREPFISGANSNARVTNCTEQIPMKASLSLLDGYAYYRLQGNAQYKSFQYYIWDTSWTGGQRLIADIRQVDSGNRNKMAYGANSCSNTPPFRQYNSFGELPAQGAIIFNYADCPQIADKWECDLGDGPWINDTPNNVKLMRDGNFVPLKLPTMIITGSHIRDSSSKAVGVVLGQNASYRTQVVDGSTPLRPGVDLNARNQYFELWNQNKSRDTSFGQWKLDPNGNASKFLTYYWSSDNGGTWKMTYEAKIDRAEFLVPFQDTSDGPVGQRWMESVNIKCDDLKTSNTAEILRSASSR
jgi:hypothetical protein